MIIDANTIISATEANQYFSRETRIAEEHGQAVILTNNPPEFLPNDLDASPLIDLTKDEKIDVIAARILKQFRPAFESCLRNQKPSFSSRKRRFS